MKAVFLDRDGVINKRIPGGYITKPSEFLILPGVIEALKILQKIYHPIVIVTNQQGIGKALMRVKDLHRVHYYLRKRLSEASVRIDAIYFCPFLAGELPPCRKPNTGMASQAKADFPQIDFSRSALVGDSDTDIAFGNTLGMFTVKIEDTTGSKGTAKTGTGWEVEDNAFSKPDQKVDSLYRFATKLDGYPHLEHI